LRFFCGALSGFPQVCAGFIETRLKIDPVRKVFLKGLDREILRSQVVGIVDLLDLIERKHFVFVKITMEYYFNETMSYGWKIKDNELNLYLPVEDMWKVYLLRIPETPKGFVATDKNLYIVFSTKIWIASTTKAKTTIVNLQTPIPSHLVVRQSQNFFFFVEKNTSKIASVFHKLRLTSFPDEYETIFSTGIHGTHVYSQSYPGTDVIEMHGGNGRDRLLAVFRPNTFLVALKRISTDTEVASANGTDLRTFSRSGDKIFENETEIFSNPYFTRIKKMTYNKFEDALYLFCEQKMIKVTIPTKEMISFVGMSSIISGPRKTLLFKENTETIGVALVETTLTRFSKRERKYERDWVRRELFPKIVFYDDEAIAEGSSDLTFADLGIYLPEYIADISGVRAYVVDEERRDVRGIKYVKKENFEVEDDVEDYIVYDAATNKYM
jgi:hypothetical protein